MLKYEVPPPCAPSMQAAAAAIATHTSSARQVHTIVPRAQQKTALLRRLHMPLLVLLLLLLLATSSKGKRERQPHVCHQPQPAPTDPANATSEELDRLVTAYAHTPALERLAEGWVGDVRIPLELAARFNASLHRATREMLRMCTQPTGLLSDFRSSGRWALRAPSNNLPQCGRRLHFVMLAHTHVKRMPALVDNMQGSFKLRGLMLQAHLLRRGHQVSWYGRLDHKYLFTNCTKPGYSLPFMRSRNRNSSGGGGVSDGGYTPVAVAVKYMEQGTSDCFRARNVPVVLDVIDAGAGLGKAYLAPLAQQFDFLLTTSRLATMVYERNAGLPAALVYHQPPNAFGLRREDRSAPVRRVALIHQPEHHILDNLRLHELLEAYCGPKGISVIAGEYAGEDFSQDELRAYALEQQHNAGEQMGYAMGYSSVDVAVLWLACDRPLLICAKPVTRLLASLSLGIPTIAIGSAAYLDVAVQYGYPLVATSLQDAVELLDLLVADPQLRHAASQLGLRIAEEFSVQHIADIYERAVCHAVEMYAGKAG